MGEGENRHGATKGLPVLLRKMVGAKYSVGFLTGECEPSGIFGYDLDIQPLVIARASKPYPSCWIPNGGICNHLTAFHHLCDQQQKQLAGFESVVCQQ